MVVWIKHFRQ